MEDPSKPAVTWFHGIAEGPLRHSLHVDPAVPLDFVVVTWLVCLILILGAFVAGRSLQRIPGKLQNLLEIVVSLGDNFVKGVIGPSGSQYTPFILTLFCFILFGSFIGIVPGMAPPTGNLNTTVALALVAFIYVNYHAIRTVGFGPFVKSFFPPPWWMVWLIGPLEILSHLIRPVTLAVRLFGNIFGEDVVIAVLAGFGLLELGAHHITVPLPLQFPMMVFSILTDLVQAAVFCMLTTIYIALLTSHGHGGHDDGHQAHAH